MSLTHVPKISRPIERRRLLLHVYRVGAYGIVGLVAEVVLHFAGVSLGSDFVHAY